MITRLLGTMIGSPSFVIRSNKQVMQNMLSEQLFILDGDQKPNAKAEETTRPTYQESDYKSSVQWPVGTCLFDRSGWVRTTRSTQRMESMRISRPWSTITTSKTIQMGDHMATRNALQRFLGCLMNHKTLEWKSQWTPQHRGLQKSSPPRTAL